MAAITKAFTAIADTAVDPDSPVDTALVTALRDNTTHLREWLGASFYAGAKQDHSHDGVDSAMVEIGPNLLRNGSFESGESGWTFTDYSGGSHAISAAEYIHGIKSLAITSTVLANGGGYAESNEYVPVGGSQFLSFEIWRWASAPNISSKAEVVWYDNAKAQISVNAIYSDTNTPTAKTLVQTGLQAPSTARYARLRNTGGIPATGTATGTVYFDGGMVGRTYIVEPLIGPAAVTQSKLKTATGEVTVAAGIILATLPGGEYGFYPQNKIPGGGSGWVVSHNLNTTAPIDAGAGTFSNTNNPASYLTQIVLFSNSGAPTYVQQRYIQSSPPWEPYLAGDTVPIFIFGLLEKSTGKVVATYTAEDPPWANNGPTIINPLGRLQRLARARLPFAWDTAKADPIRRSQYEAELTKLRRYRADKANAPLLVAEMARKFTQTEKNADMPLIPHPFPGFDPTKHMVVVINPTDDDFCGNLHCRHNFLGDSVADVLHGNYLLIDNTPMPGLATPPGVMAVRARWKLT